jgi:porin
MNTNKHVILIEYFMPFVLFLFGLLCLAQPAIGADPDYSGDFLKRSTLTGDWGGVRNDLAKKGVTFDANLVLTDQGDVNGGKNREWEAGGRSSLLFNVDTGKLGLWPGGFLTAELEGNFGKGVNQRNGGLMPANTNQMFPVPAKEGVTLPALNFAQFLSEYTGVVVGKIDTTSGDMNEFAHGKGDTQRKIISEAVCP